MLKWWYKFITNPRQISYNPIRIYDDHIQSNKSFTEVTKNKDKVDILYKLVKISFYGTTICYTVSMPDIILGIKKDIRIKNIKITYTDYNFCCRSIYENQLFEYKLESTNISSNDNNNISNIIFWPLGPPDSFRKQYAHLLSKIELELYEPIDNIIILYGYFTDREKVIELDFC